MKIHILGICGTFMGGIAAIARELGHDVSGSDQGVYPPMSDTLRQQGITLMSGYLPQHLDPAPDLVIIGNALSRGNPAVEYVLNQNIPYTSGPQWLAENVLQQRHVLAVSGTHGKTTTTAMLAWILESAGLNPGYLIGGVAKDFTTTARLGERYFVIEADEYDTAYFDKRSKFIHYRPRTLIMNNLEFDHADIFTDLDAIKLQFQYALRGVPGDGCIISNANDEHVQSVLARGCWSRQAMFGDERGWHARDVATDFSEFTVYEGDERQGVVRWAMLGAYNMMNGLAAIAAATEVGMSARSACDALSQFGGVKRRLEQRGVVKGAILYDDFAHHSTAIEATLKALRARVGKKRIIAVLQFGSNTMMMPEHSQHIIPALAEADEVILLEPDNFSTQAICNALGPHAQSFTDVDAIVTHVAALAKPDDQLLVMSNKGFDGLHEKLLAL
ncbi:MAG: UDP-N-acetylmuramate:L-alanyl-gamma-D-glutamyl-meso-diaminopimelate ligase [Coxiella sp. (in: Bacteria)]|nr:MAG: UDP-N-acetylmuramate:L-alanyl-gamma-D-glutamyl-meso-diaminopimelate ligase [Coxiella sp. (in: g-proteobacteria)]